MDRVSRLFFLLFDSLTVLSKIRIQRLFAESEPLG